MPADKTPGEVAYAAMTIEVRWRPVDWGKLDPKLREGWEQAARAVLRLAEPTIAAAVSDMGRVRDIRKVLAGGRGVGPCNDPDLEAAALYDLIATIEAVLGEPTPEAAEACAEDAGAERSKSPPPAER